MRVFESSRHAEHPYLGAPQQEPKRIGIIDIIANIRIEDDLRGCSLRRRRVSSTN